MKATSSEPYEIDEITPIDLNELLTVGNPNCLLIKVHGDSEDIDVRDGDWVMLARDRRPNLDDLILTRSNGDGGYTITRFDSHRVRHSFYLVGADVDAGRDGVDERTVIGVVTHIIHQTAAAAASPAVHDSSKEVCATKKRKSRRSHSSNLKLVPSAA